MNRVVRNFVNFRAACALASAAQTGHEINRVARNLVNFRAGSPAPAFHAGERMR
jgi:hypothetical protein